MALRRSTRRRDDEQRMSLVDHLAELRTRILVSLGAVAVGAVVVLVFWEPILGFLVDPYREITASADNPGGNDLITTGPLEGFSVRLRVSAYGGIALASPVVLWQVWRFVTPGLHANERKYAVPFLLSAVVLFALGALLAWFTVPRALDFLLNFAGPDVDPLLRADEYISFISLMMLAFGVAFEFPILLVFLLLVGVVTTDTLRRFRRHTIVGIAIFVAIITPSGDPISMLMLTVPLYAFYEATIVIGRLMKR